MTKGILSRVRDEGYREGWSQAGQIQSDHYYQLGLDHARDEAPNRWLWLGIGLILDGVLRNFVG